MSTQDQINAELRRLDAEAMMAPTADPRLQGLDALTPLHYLALVLMAEDRRIELGLAPNAPVEVVRWLCLRDDLREAAVETARAWSVENVGSVEAACAALVLLPRFTRWVSDEMEAARVRALRSEAPTADQDAAKAPLSTPEP